jgi:hypothetical protein
MWRGWMSRRRIEGSSRCAPGESTCGCGGRRCHRLASRSGIRSDRSGTMASRGGWAGGGVVHSRGGAPHSQGRVLFSRARLPHSRGGVLVAPACAASGLVGNSLLEPEEMWLEVESPKAQEETLYPVGLIIWELGVLFTAGRAIGSHRGCRPIRDERYLSPHQVRQNPRVLAIIQRHCFRDSLGVCDRGCRGGLGRCRRAALSTFSARAGLNSRRDR